MDGGKTVAIVSTGAGKIEGSLENGVFVFRGVPYAAPPTGKLRWLPPQPIIPWNGVRPANKFGAIAPQNEMPGAESIGLDINESQDEDCLFLNVWTRGLDRKRRPVMIWIHGGAFIIGSGSQTTYRSHNLVARKDLVLVTINYRLGALGFMNLKEATGGQIPATGCEGLLDQIAAIEWTRNNIEAFGGDPENITVFGESAGAMSIADLMAMPAAQGKFQKAILQSGAGNTVGSLEEGAGIAAKWLEILESRNANALRSLAVERILYAQQKLGLRLQSEEGRITPFQPIVDRETLPDIPIKAIEKGRAAGIKTLAGTNLDEFRLFNIMNPALKDLDEAGMVSRLESLVPREQVSNVTAAYRRGLEARKERLRPSDVLTAVQTDIMFRMPALRLVEAQCKNNQPAYNYLFKWKSPVAGGTLGACHALEIGFVFGNFNAAFCGSGPAAEALSRKMQDAWYAFACTGDPSCEGLGRWEPYGDSRTTMVLDRECRLENAPYEGERAVWDAFEMQFTKPI
jgi:para-nitrobenzyl esterase